MSEVKMITQKAYNDCVNSGYAETSSKEMIYKSYKGQYVHLKKDLSTCGQTARIAGTILGGPILLIAILGSGGLAIGSCQPYMRHCVRPGMDGGYEVEGFVKDIQLTKEMYDKDFRELGTKGWSKESAIALAESGKYDWMTSKKYPQHKYISVWSPTTNITYLIVFQNGDSKQARTWALTNEGSGPLNAEQIKKKAENLCGACKVKRIVMVDESSPLIQTDSTDDGLSIGSQSFNEEIV